MDNQQGKINDIQIGWIAGIIDGEGCIDFQQSKSKYYTTDRQGLDVYYYPRVRISMTHPQTLIHLQELLTKLNVGHHISWKNPTEKKWKKGWSISITGLKRVQRFLGYLTPYLVTKKSEAEQMIDFINLRLLHEQHDGYSKEETALIQKIRNR